MRPRLLTAALGVAVAVLLAAGPPAQAAKSCGVGSGRGYGTTKVTSLKVSGTSCRKGRKLVRAFHACRPGKKGKCGQHLLGYSCTESRYHQRKHRYDSRVVCALGGKRVRHTYTQRF
jgi:uncharacterized membrane protein